MENIGMREYESPSQSWAKWQHGQLAFRHYATAQDFLPLVLAYHKNAQIVDRQLFWAIEW